VKAGGKVVLHQFHVNAGFLAVIPDVAALVFAGIAVRDMLQAPQAEKERQKKYWQLLNEESSATMPSAKFLKSLPPVDELNRIVRARAMLDLVLTAHNQYSLPAFDYQPHWAADAKMAKYDNGSGDDMFFFFQAGEAIIKGFDHESGISPYGNKEHNPWPGIYENVPAHWNQLLDDPAVVRGDVTFCLWTEKGKWKSGKVKLPKVAAGAGDGTEWMLNELLPDAEAYVQWAADYYDVNLKTSIVQAI